MSVVGFLMLIFVVLALFGVDVWLWLRLRRQRRDNRPLRLEDPE